MNGALSSRHMTAGVLVWGATVFAGFKLVSDYQTTPGASAEAPAQWPADSRLRRVPGRPTLVMLAHPRCACTRASLVELNQVMARVHELVTAYVLFAKPDGVPAGWEDTDLWRRAHEIPGVTPLLDEGEREARSFHAETSGQTVLYDATGRLVFSGGITLARGHVGTNPGEHRVETILTGAEPDRNDAAVFGCPLDAPTRDAG
jgi:glyoxylase-like metal-dependent hydrolase (beta-lactamase superfamily II)